MLQPVGVRRLKQLILFAVLVALAVAGARWYFSSWSDEAIIRDRLTTLARLVSVKPKEGNLTRIAKGERLPGYFAPKVEIRVRDSGRRVHRSLSRRQILKQIRAVQMMESELILHFYDIQVTVQADGRRATAFLTVVVDIAGEKTAVVQELKVTLRKTSQHWTLHEVETIETLQV